jgi:hypothetical protein
MKIILLLCFALGAGSLRAADAPDPCALVTAAQLEPTFGKLKGAAKPDVGVQKEKECRYENSEGNFLVFRIYPAARWGMQKGMNSENNPTALPGLGDEAYIVKKGTDKEIYILKKDWILEIDSSVDSEKLKTIAAVAAAKLP